MLAPRSCATMISKRSLASFAVFFGRALNRSNKPMASSPEHALEKALALGLDEAHRPLLAEQSRHRIGVGLAGVGGSRRGSPARRNWTPTTPRVLQE